MPLEQNHCIVGEIFSFYHPAVSVVRDSPQQFTGFAAPGIDTKDFLFSILISLGYFGLFGAATDRKNEEEYENERSSFHDLFTAD
jgi:hypothetical protein